MFQILLAQVAQKTEKLADEAIKAAEKLPADAARDAALDNVRQLQFSKLNAEDWIYIAEYYGIRVLALMVVMAVAWTVSGWLGALVLRALNRVDFDETLSKFFARMTRWLVLLLVGLTCVSYFGFDTTSFAAVLGAAGLAIGLAFQGTLSNFAAGGMLLIFRPFKVEDVVNVAGLTGKVNEIALFTTEIDTFDGRRIIVPNSKIYGAVIENITYHPHRRIDVPVGAAYDADLDTTREVLEKAIASVDDVLTDPEPAVVLNSLGASSVDWVVRGWARREDFGRIKQELTRAVKVHLDQAGIGIPFPQMDVHVDPPLAAK